MKKKYLTRFILIVLFLLVWSLVIYFVGADKLVNTIGLYNTFIVIFIIGTIGGVSTVSSATFYTSLTAFAAGGANPLILGIVGGIAISIGDSLFYFLGKNGEKSLAKKAKQVTLHFSQWLEKQPKWLVPVVAFVYTGITPLPNDILMVTLGISRYKYKFLILPLIMGNILLTCIVAFFASNI